MIWDIKSKILFMFIYIELIVEDYKIVVCLFIDVIDFENFAYRV